MRSSNKSTCIMISGKDNVNWSIDSDRKNTLKLFESSSEFEVTSNIFKADIFYSVWYSELEKPWIFYPLLLLKKIKKIKIFAVITNQIQNTPDKLTRLNRLVDVWISPNTNTTTFIKKHKTRSIQVPFLIDQTIFKKINKSKQEIAKQLKIDYSKIRKKILIGSFQRDSIGTDLSKPKWQKNPDLLISILKQLPQDKFILVLAGPRRHYLINKCKELNIPYLFIGDKQYIDKSTDDIKENNLSLNKINLLYNLIDIYLVTSASEGGPKAILETALTETLVFSTDVGLASDILHPKFIYKPKQLTPLLENIKLIMENKDIFNKEMLYHKNNYLSLINKTNILPRIKKAYDSTQ